MKPWDNKIHADCADQYALWFYMVTIPIIYTNVSCSCQIADPSVGSCYDETCRQSFLQYIAKKNEAIIEEAREHFESQGIQFNTVIDLDTMIEHMQECIDALKRTRENGITNTDDGRFAADIHASMGNGGERQDNVSQYVSRTQTPDEFRS